MAKKDDSSVVSTLRIFGTVRVWTSIVVGSLVFVAAVTFFALSYTWESNYEEVVAEVTGTDCGSVRRTTRCSSHGERSACVTTESVECDVSLQHPGGSGTLSLVFDEGFEPQPGDQMQVFADRNEPSNLAEQKTTREQRLVVRLIATVVGAISLVVIVVNSVLAATCGGA